MISMKKVKFYEAPQAYAIALQTESAFLSSSAEDEEKMGMKDLIYEDIQWN